MSYFRTFFDLNKHHFYEAIIKSTFDGCVIYHYNNGVFNKLTANDAYFKLTGYSKNEIENDTPLLESLKEYNLVTYHALEEAIGEGKKFRKEILFFLKSGEPFWADVRFEPVNIPGDDGAFYVAIYHEITLQKSKEAELKKAIDEMEASRNLKERFLSNMSHEIRTPVTGVLGMVQLLEQSSLTAQQKDYLGSIRFSAQNLLVIIDDILEFNSIHSREFELRNNEFNPASVLQNLLKMLQHKADEKNISLTCDIDQDFPETVTGDAARLNQVLMNLIGNAIKFTSEGEVSITATSKKINGEINLSYCVEDTGIGIPKQLLNTIFSSFNQASKNTSGNYRGTGLGLSIVNSLVSKMGGTIEVESSENNGSSFTVNIPFKPAEKQKENSKNLEQPGSNDNLNGLNILVVDDHPINRKIASGLLGKLGVIIDEADTGEEALAKIENNNYDVVLMDVHMPGMGGLEATRKIKAGLAPELPVFAVTASIMEKDVEECRLAGMDDFISKPFNLQTLVQKIKAAVGKTGSLETIYDEIESSKPARSVVNTAALEELSGGSAEIMREMIQLFNDKTPGLVKNLEKAYSEEEYEEMSKIAHTIKPTYNYVGTDEGVKLSQKIEDYHTKPFGRKELKSLIDQLKELTDMAVKELREMESSL